MGFQSAGSKVYLGQGNTAGENVTLYLRGNLAKWPCRKYAGAANVLKLVLKKR